jgi:hypothetical protein
MASLRGSFWILSIAFLSLWQMEYKQLVRENMRDIGIRKVCEEHKENNTKQEELEYR